MPKSICNCYYWAIPKFSLVAWPVGASEGWSVCSFLWNGLKISTGGHKFLCITLWLWQICRKKLTLFLLQNAPPPADLTRIWTPATEPGGSPRRLNGEPVHHLLHPTLVWRRDLNHIESGWFSGKRWFTKSGGLIYFSGWNWVEDKNKSSKQNKKIKPR